MERSVIVYSPRRRARHRCGLVLAAALGLASVVPAAFASSTTQSSSNVLYRINCGAGKLNAHDGGPTWDRDTGRQPHATLSASHTKTWVNGTSGAVDASVAPDVPHALFQSERFDRDGQTELAYSLPVPAGTDVAVTLFFRDSYAGTSATGARVFDVLLDGEVVLDDYDIVADVGHMTGVAKTFERTSDGVVDIELQHVVENPLLSGIEVSTRGGVATGGLEWSPHAIDFGTKVQLGRSVHTVVELRHVGGAPITIDDASLGGQHAGDFTHDLATPLTLAPSESVDVRITFEPRTLGARRASLELDLGGGKIAKANVFGTAISQPPAGQVLHRVNCGGDELTSLDQWQDWETDTQGSPHPSNNGGGTAWANNMAGTTDPSLPAAAPPELFLTERFDDPTAPDLSYSFPVAQGTPVEVRLYFRDSFEGTNGVGKRVFDVVVDDQTVLDDFDLVAEVGHLVGTMRAFTITSDGSVDIALAREVENPLINAIEVLSSDGSVSNFLSMKPAEVLYPPTAVADTETAEIVLENESPTGPAITVDALSLEGTHPDDFSHDFVGPVEIQPGSSMVVTVTFAPTAIGTRDARLVAEHSGTNVAETLLSGEAVGQIAFVKGELKGTGLQAPTSLQFGPDGRLYVAEVNGLIHALTITRTGKASYTAAAVETIDLVHTMANFNDDGSVAPPGVVGRSVTGILVAGTHNNPVIFVGSSDPRQNTHNLDTNSGILSRLTWTGSEWEKLDLVRGLPRSYHDHFINGLYLDEASHLLYVCSGGNTNQGAPSTSFSLLPEYALTSAILTVDLKAVGESTYDLPTLDDEDRPGVQDTNDPFGGNAGKNQAIIVPGGPVQVFAPGFRNIYDLCVTAAGRMYTVDNGPNAGWGDIPLVDPNGSCTNDPSEPGVTYPDGLHYIGGAGYYGGHPNPTRADPANTFNDTNPQSPVPFGNSIECQFFVPGVGDGSLTTFPSSTNGICEYTATNFGGLMLGDLLMISLNGFVRRVELSASGKSVKKVSNLVSKATHLPLDIVSLDDEARFPGTIWVCSYTGKIIVFEPDDFFNCTGADDPNLDEDSDGYSNADEIANGTSPCSAADTPPDWDGDFLSDLLDPDDDNDTLSDELDPLAVDDSNGAAIELPIELEWENGADGGLLNTGFRGLMTNGTDDYLSLFDGGNMTVGGAAGVLTVDDVYVGTAAGGANSQHYGFQIGAQVLFETAPFSVQARVVAPFEGTTPIAGQEIGMFIGRGGQDDYAQLVVSGEGGVQFSVEISGSRTTFPLEPISLPGPEAIDLYMILDPSSKTVQPAYRTEVGGVPGEFTLLGSPVVIPSGWLHSVMVTGIISTSEGTNPLSATWDFLRVTSGRTGQWAPGPEMPLAIGEVAGGVIDGKLYIVGESSSATQVFDLQTQTWESNLAVRPFTGHHHSAEVHGGKLYLIGALGPGAGTVQIYDPLADAWTLGTPMPWAGGSVCTALIGDKIYAAGGIVGSSTVDDCAVYDITADSWTMLTPMPAKKGRNHAATASDGERMFIFGGRGFGSGDGNMVANGFDDVQVYDPATDSWDASYMAGSTLQPLPIGRGGMGKAAYFENRFYVIGGETLDGPGAQPGNVYDRVDVYDPITGAWTLDAPLPTPRHGIFPMIHDGRIYVAGGGEVAGFSKSDVVEIYSR